MDYGNVAYVNITDRVADRTPVSPAVDGLAADLIFDLTWTQNPEFMGRGWWPVEDASPPLGRWERYGDEVLTVDVALGKVIAVSGIVAWPQELIDADIARVRREIVAGAQKYMDDFFKTRNYDGVLSATTYYNSSVPQFQLEGRYAVQLRDQVWVLLLQLGADPTFQPLGFDDVRPLLPPLEWPV